MDQPTRKPPMIEVRIKLHLADLARPDLAEVVVSNAVYEIGKAIFERAGEHNRHEAGTPVWRGNGHHAAQALAEAAVAQWRRGASK